MSAQARQPRRFGVALACGIAALALALAGAALAQSSGGVYTLTSHSIAGGGGRSTGGVYALEGTIGRHDAGNAQSGGVFELAGGFNLGSGGALQNELLRDGFE